MVLGGLDNPIKISISQFYGIEINDFAVTVAKTALWIAESQMMKETESIVHLHLDFLPLTTNAFIVEGNALRFDWKELIAPDKLSYIMGNPPFVGYTYQDKEQKKDIQNIFVDEKGQRYNAIGKLDYASCWYFKAAEYMQGTNIHAAFVSTNSITQGEQVNILWKPVTLRFSIHINFAWRTFKWNSESKNQAAVHCVIIGFSQKNDIEKFLYDDGIKIPAYNINSYLVDAPTIFLSSRSAPISPDTPKMMKGSQPTDHGNFILDAEARQYLLKHESQAGKYIRLFLGSREFINHIDRWCLWMPNITPEDLRSMPLVKKRIENVREFRLKSTKTATRKCADTPYLFQENRQPKDDVHFIVVPEVSSQNRRYVPMGFLDGHTIISNKLQIIVGTTMYHFGILNSNVHMAWMRAVCGRLKSDYDYSSKIVYNNFPWPTPTDVQRAKIEKTAQAILDARSKYPHASLADLYDELTMPPELRKAHQENDKAVMDAYGFDWRHMSESDCVAALMKLYQQLVTANS